MVTPKRMALTRNEECDQARVGGSSRREEAKEQHIGKRRRQQGEAEQGGDGDAARHHQHPRPVDDKCQGYKHGGRRRQLACRSRDGWHAQISKTAPENTCEAIRERSSQNGKLRQHVAAKRPHDVTADHDGNATESNRCSDQPLPCQLFVGREDMRHQNGEKRRRGIQN